MLPLVLDVLVPVAKEQPLEDLGLDRVLLRFLDALLVEGIAFGKGFVRMLRPYRGDEGDLVAVARPDAGRRAGADRRELFRLAAVDGDDPELVCAAAARFEQD